MAREVLVLEVLQEVEGRTAVEIFYYVRLITIQG